MVDIKQKYGQRAIIAILMVVAFVTTITAPASSVGMTPSVKAGDTRSDWYKCKQVPVLKDDGSIASKVANLRICNWDDPNGPGQIYLVDMDGDTSLTPDLNTYRLYVNNVCICNTNNVTLKFSNPRSVQDFRGQWLRGVFSQYAKINDF